MENTFYPAPLENITRIEYHGQPVLTYEQLAKALSTPEKVVSVNSLQANFRNNRDRFINGKHFFEVTGEELDILRLKNFQLQISPKTRTVYLWTRRGVARHCKSVNTNVAWDVYETLEDTYFNVEKLLRDKPLKSINDFERGKELVRVLPNLKDPYMQKRLAAKVTNLLMGEEFFTVPDSQPVVQLSLFS